MSNLCIQASFWKKCNPDIQSIFLLARLDISVSYDDVLISTLDKLKAFYSLLNVNPTMFNG